MPDAVRFVVDHHLLNTSGKQIRSLPCFRAPIVRLVTLVSGPPKKAVISATKPEIGARHVRSCMQTSTLSPDSAESYGRHFLQTEN